MNDPVSRIDSNFAFAIWLVLSTAAQIGTVWCLARIARAQESRLKVQTENNRTMLGKIDKMNSVVQNAGIPPLPPADLGPSFRN